MPVSKEVFMTRWYDELWNNANENVIDEMLHPNVKAHGLWAEPIVGKEQFKQFYKAFRKDYGNIKVVIEKNLMDGNYLVSLCSVKGIHNDTGKPIEFFGTSIALVEDGLLVEGWNCFDFLTLNIQNGKIKPEQLS
ncbi:MAG TPA: ester cyclase [Mucilaginibacter sp.]|jgi:predicted SnoaL-like aldol condensation-catalyzing enzyme